MAREIGRPLKFTPEKKDQIIETLKDTGNITVTARACAVSRKAMYNNKEVDPDFSRRWDEALKESIELLEFECRRRALEGYLDPVYHRGKVVGHVRKFSDTLAIFLLKGLKPYMYRDNVSVDVNANVEKLVKIINETCPDKASEIRRRIQTDILEPVEN